MSFGIELYNDRSNSIIANSENVFIVDYIDLAVGSFSRVYNLAPGEVLYAVAVFNRTTTANNPCLWHLNVIGNTVYWVGQDNPRVYPVTSIVVYKKGNVSSFPAKNTFGAEFTSNTGNLFVVSDSNPFTYFNNYTLDGRTGAKEVNTGIPGDSRVLVFKNFESNFDSAYQVESGQYVKDGTWHLSLKACRSSVRFFVFADREHRDVSGGSNYGFEFYDKNGRLVIGNNSKPLKLYSYKPPYFYNQWDLGFKTYALEAIHLLYPHSFNPYITDNGGYGTAISEGSKWVTGYYMPICEGSNEIKNGSTTFPSDFLYIKESDYL